MAETFVGDRVDFAASMIDGRTVQELAPASVSADEIAALWCRIAADLGEGAPRRRTRARSNALTH